MCMSGGTKVEKAQGMTTPQVISATQLRTKTRDILELARFRGEHFIVETFGKPMVAIVGIEEYWEIVQDAGHDEESGSTQADGA
jgi:hypothetical protein